MRWTTLRAAAAAPLLPLLSLLPLSTLPCAPAAAAALRVSPILVEGAAGADAGLTLRNVEPRPVTVQVRVYRWSLAEGRDDLVPTDDVVASPPIVTVAPLEDYRVRVDRAAAGEPRGEESYRIVVDEVPSVDRQRNGTVAVVLRYVIPAFFAAPDATPPRLAWSFASRGGRTVLRAVNTGDRRVQVSDLALRAGRATTAVQKGLAGYVLGHSARDWPLPAGARPAPGASVTARGDHGALDAPIAP